jgi:RNA polymerase sigma-70 factor (ECF subfamily)
MQSLPTASRPPRRIAPIDTDLDGLLIACIARRDEQALGELYDRYRRLIYAIAFRIAADHNSAEEITQDVFHAVWQSAGSFQSGANLTSWLMGITRHRAIDATRSRRFRARHREQTLFDEAGGLAFSTEEPTDRLLLREVIRVALGRLPAAQRQPLTLAFYDGLTHTEIADHLGEPVGTIKSRMRLGMHKLRELLAHGDE